MLGEVLGRVLFGQPCAVEELALQQGQVGLWGQDGNERATDPKAPWTQGMESTAQTVVECTSQW